jgi:hypothetical protein
MPAMRCTSGSAASAIWRRRLKLLHFEHLPSSLQPSWRKNQLVINENASWAYDSKHQGLPYRKFRLGKRMTWSWAPQTGQKTCRKARLSLIMCSYFVGQPSFSTALSNVIA